MAGARRVPRVPPEPTTRPPQSEPPQPDRRAPAGFAPIAIGLGLTLIHLIGIPVTNLSVNPARSTGPAVFVQGWALAQLWLFWVAPIFGALIAGGLYAWLGGHGWGYRLRLKGNLLADPGHGDETTTGGLAHQLSAPCLR